MKDGTPRPIRDRKTAAVSTPPAAAPVEPNSQADSSTNEDPSADKKAKEKEFLPKYEENNEGEVIAAVVKLRYPKDVRQWLPDVGTLTSVRIQEITMEDRRTANRAKKPGDTELDDEMMLMSIVTKLPFEVIVRLNSRDYNTIQIAMGRLFF